MSFYLNNIIDENYYSPLSSFVVLLLLFGYFYFYLFHFIWCFCFLFVYLCFLFLILFTFLSFYLVLFCFVYFFIAFFVVFVLSNTCLAPPQAPACNGAAVSEYRLEWGAAEGSMQLCYTGAALSHEMRGLLPATNYFCRVQVRNYRCHKHAYFCQNTECLSC